MKVFRAILLLVAVSGSAQRAQAVVSGHPMLYVSNETSGDLSVIDTVTGKVVATIPVGKRPRGIQSSPDHKTVYVALSGSVPAGPNKGKGAPAGGDDGPKPGDDKTQDGMGAVDVSTNRVLERLPGGSDPEQFAVGKDGTKLYIANEDASALSVVGVAARHVEQQILVGKEPEGVGVSPDGRWVYVTCEASNSVFVVDAATGKVAKEIVVGERPRAVAFAPDSSFAYVSLEMAGAISVVSLPNHEVVKTIHLKDKALKPMGLVVAADGASVFVSTGRGGKVLRIATASNTVAAAATVGDRPWGIALSPDGKTLYTANGPSNDVSVVDVATFRETRRIKVGTKPWGLVLIP